MGDEEKYVITPKGIAVLALMECGLIDSTDDPRINGFWRCFDQEMMKAGYVATGEEEEP